jgi:nicotinic acid mononucleotide adenylyltransferase
LCPRMVSVAPEGRADAGSDSARTSRIFLVDAVTPDVSSTGIRKRLLAGEPIAKLVPAAVERHIVQHGLYAERGGPLAADHLHGEN